MKRVISLDIETLDTSASSVVLSIGACVVDANGIHETVHVRLDIQEQINKKRTISASTLIWWMNQDAAVRKEATRQSSSVTLALDIVGNFILDAGSPHVFVKGPQFDAAILDDLCDDFGVDRLCHFTSWRDLRTLTDVIEWTENEDLQFEWFKVQNEIIPGNHDALADAKAQGSLISWFMMEVAK